MVQQIILDFNYSFFFPPPPQILSIWWVIPTPPLPLRSETIPVHRLRKEVCPQRSPVETPQSSPVSTKQQDRTLCKRTPVTPALTDWRWGRGWGRCAWRKRDKGIGWWHHSPNTLKRTPCRALFACVCAYAGVCDAHSWYCDNLLGGEERLENLKQNSVTWHSNLTDGISFSYIFFRNLIAKSLSKKICSFTSLGNLFNFDPNFFFSFYFF